MADSNNDKEHIDPPPLAEQIKENRRGSLFRGDDAQRKASVAQLTTNTTGE